MSAAETYWNIVPYVSLAILVIGLWWRYRYDKFGWTTRSSQLYENRLLRIASPLFHFGMLVVILGHIIGLVIPESWTEALGISEHQYHWIASVPGVIAGIATVIGVGLLIYRRRATGPVFIATTRNDKIMYVVLVAAIVAGLATTLIGAFEGNNAHNYRETVSPWFRSIWYLHPEGGLMAQAPTSFHVHVTIALVLFAIWPFTRLVHVFSAPFAYLFRPYVVYRSRSAAGKGELVGSQPHRKGW